MRDISKWTRAELDAMVANGDEEGLHLDFKRSAALSNGTLRDDLSKDVSAFANSAGGLIVFGIEEANKKAVRVDEGITSATMNAERLEDIIFSNVFPRPVGVRARAIDLGADRSAMVVAVPAATSLAPHQASDRRYYRRYETKNQPLYDHEIRDLMRRSSISAPDVTLTIQNDNSSDRIRCRPRLSNQSPTPIEYGRLILWMDRRAKYDPTMDGYTRIEDRSIMVAGETHTLAGYSIDRLKDQLPVTPELAASMSSIVFIVPTSHDLYIGWEFRCPGITVARFGRFDGFALRNPIVWLDDLK